MEQRLLEIWQSVLGAPGLGVEDNFFEHGGHSLLALRLLAAVERETGRQIPVAALFRAPSPRRAARLLERAAPEAERTLVRLAEPGGGEPLFLVHPGGGGVLGYAALARRLGAEHPIHALQAPGYEGETEPLATVPALAEAHLAAVRSARPRGPYRLGGWSFGGTVAVEMARRLREAGEETAPLVLFDAFPSPAGGAEAPPSETEVWLAFAAEILGAGAAAAGLAENPAGLAEDLARAEPEERLERLAAAAQELGGEPLPPPPRLRALFAVFRAGVEAIWGHRERPFDGRILLFRPEEPTPLAPRTDLDPAAGWRRLGAEVEEVSVPGNHFTMLSPPHLDSLVPALRERLAVAAPGVAAAAVEESHGV